MNKALNLVLVLALVASLMVVSEARRGQQRERPGLRPRPRPEPSKKMIHQKSFPFPIDRQDVSNPLTLIPNFGKTFRKED
ncbi:hypothetical protein BpHYR1_010198 [Brachionus plicatilis]|uniref:Uncharacterized protein n=1 Tax=Brachionus plicatilis TaxID=10195 RepID=A0A3M7QZR2_BRAPC|nr:hypothetical protein BpHYR1_010198 [Brachionus plicatilis]